VPALACETAEGFVQKGFYYRDCGALVVAKGMENFTSEAVSGGLVNQI
jgi:hypothetical protein